MQMVLEGSVDPWVMCVGVVQFESPMQKEAVAIEKHEKLEDHEVDVRGHDHREDNERSRANQLIHVPEVSWPISRAMNALISDHSEWRWVVEVVVVLVLAPPDLGDVAEAVIVELEKVGSNPDENKLEDMVSQTVPTGPAVGRAVTQTSQVERRDRADHGRDTSLDHLNDLISDHKRLREPRVALPPPPLIRRLHVERKEQN